MNKAVVCAILFALVGLSFAIRVPQVHARCNKEEWNAWKAEHKKVYASAEEESTRFVNFCKNLKRIDALNKSSGHSASFGLNKFSDISEEEFSRQRKMPKQDALAMARSCLAKGVSRYSAVEKFSAPASFDWRSQHKLNPVQDQEQCGSCWAFSTIANIESVYAIKHGQLQKFSEQFLVDCSHGCSLVQGQSVCNQGCNGGFQWNAMQDVLQWGGVVTEQSYPYRGVTGNCQVQFSSHPTLYAAIGNYTCLSGPALGNEAQMANFLVQNGPLSIAMNAGYLQTYTGGIVDPWYSWECDPTSLDHAVLIVGYGTESGTPYWIVRNSWGPSWGENGYFRIRRGKNTCGIASAVASVTY